MIIEFTGCTSAGKSWVIERLVKIAAERDIRIISGYDFIVSRFGLSIEQPRLKSVAVDFLLLPWFFIAFLRFRPLIGAASTYLFNKQERILLRLNIFRNLLKVLAIFLYIGPRVNRTDICILDEGTIHSLHNLLVSHRHGIPTYFLEQVKHLPFYDKVIIVRAPSSLIAERALSRSDAPWADLEARHWKIVADRADELYDYLSATPALQNAIFSINNDGDAATIEQHLLDLLQRCNAQDAD